MSNLPRAQRVAGTDQAAEFAKPGVDPGRRACPASRKETKGNQAGKYRILDSEIMTVPFEELRLARRRRRAKPNSDSSWLRR